MFIIQNPKTIICWFTYPKKYRYIASAEIPELKTYGTILIRSEIEPHTPPISPRLLHRYGIPNHE